LIFESQKDRLFRDIRNFQNTLRNIQEERISHILRGGSLKPRNPSVILHSRNSGDIYIDQNDEKSKKTERVVVLRIGAAGSVFVILNIVTNIYKKYFKKILSI